MNLLDQWNEHVIKGNQLSRELEDFEGIMHVADLPESKVALFADGETTFIDLVLPDNLMASLKSLIVRHIVNTKENKEIELKKHMNSWKPATINPEFEAAVKDMEQSNKKQTPDDKEDIPFPDGEFYPKKPDPVEEKLSNILDKHEKQIKSKPVPEDKSYGKYPAKKDNRKKNQEAMTEEVVRRMYTIEGKNRKQIAEHYGVSETAVNNFLYLHGIRRRSSNPVKAPEETERP